MDLIFGDCLEKLKSIQEETVDSLVTDPPAGISFMGKSWDGNRGGRNQWIAWMTEVMRECHRVLRPGAHGLVWALPRTSHWTATALEDAGFEIRDVVTHLFGTGFPKSLDISKAIDKAAGVERKKKIVTGKVFTGSNDNISGVSGTREAVSDEAVKWSGWGTALKPASEHWILVRKPISEKTVAANVLKWGTGGINIDAGRIGYQSESDMKSATPQGKCTSGGLVTNIGIERKEFERTELKGRFPANLVLSHSGNCTEDVCDPLDCAVRKLDAQSGTLTSGTNPTRRGSEKFKNAFGEFQGQKDCARHRGIDSGSASRFFYCAKISSGERNAGCEWMPDRAPPQEYRMGAVEGSPRKPEKCTAAAPVKNHHPTVKPKKLMGYLIKLITPPGGVVLDPFMGSGSTGISAKEQGFRFIGIEKEQEYFEIASARIEEHR